MAGSASLAERLARVRERIEVAARRSGRTPSAVRLVAVSKFHSVEEIEEAIAAGVTEFGENRVQEAEAKRDLITAPGLVWHLVGRLQSNKVKKAIQSFGLIHSISALDIARRVDRLAGEQEKIQDVLIQVQVAEEETKQGLPILELDDALQGMAELEHLRVSGLMVLPPYLPNPEDVRPFFVKLRELRDALRARGLVGPAFSELSMGMSHDFEVAVEEGATLVRVGTAIFGERPATRA